MNILRIIASYIPPFLSDFSSLLTGLGPRACCTVWRRSEREKTNIIYECIFMESRKMVLMNIFAG